MLKYNSKISFSSRIVHNTGRYIMIYLFESSSQSGHVCNYELLHFLVSNDDNDVTEQSQYSRFFNFAREILIFFFFFVALLIFSMQQIKAYSRIRILSNKFILKFQRAIERIICLCASRRMLNKLAKIQIFSFECIICFDNKRSSTRNLHTYA